MLWNSAKRAVVASNPTTGETTSNRRLTEPQQRPAKAIPSAVSDRVRWRAHTVSSRASFVNRENFPNEVTAIDSESSQASPIAFRVESRRNTRRAGPKSSGRPLAKLPILPAVLHSARPLDPGLGSALLRCATSQSTNSRYEFALRLRLVDETHSRLIAAWNRHADLHPRACAHEKAK